MTAWACTLVLCFSGVGFAPASAISVEEALNMTANLTFKTKAALNMTANSTFKTKAALNMTANLTIKTKAALNMTANLTIKTKEALNTKANLTFKMREVLNMTDSSPVTRVVKLLNFLAEEIEKEGEYEEDLYEKFICWGKDLIKKTDENINENIRIVEVLQRETQMMNSEDVSITDEKERNQKEVARLRIEIMERNHERNVDKSNFDAANEQMRQAIIALGEAIAVLQATYDKHKDGQAAFLGIKEDSSVYEKESEALSNAVQLAERFLDQSDALFVRRLFTAQVPVPKHNWNKLNKKANFAKSYKARSARILETFAKVKASIEENKANAVVKEQTAAAEWVKLDASLRDQLATAQAALQSATAERAAKLQRIMKLSVKITFINDELKLDADTIKKCETDMENKKKEWVVRKALRGEELKAIAKTVEILRADDARDTFTKSYKSQGYTFLQERSSSLRASMVSKAADALADAARKTGDKQLAQLAASVKSLQPSQPGQLEAMRRNNAAAMFDSITPKIDKIIEDLEKEGVKDLEKKEKCEADREINAGNAITHGRSVDDFSALITENLAQIEEYKNEVAKQDAVISQIEKELVAAEGLRLAERKAYEKDRADDVSAIEIINSAKQTLNDFYVKNELKVVDETAPAAVNLLQSSTHSHYNPPKVWVNGEAGYGGRVGEADAILYMMSQIVKDIKSDINLHDGDEQKAIKEYDDFVVDSGNRKTEAERLRQEATDNIAAQETKLGENKGFRQDAFLLMKAEEEKMDELLPGCSYYTINFELRRSNRNIEIDGLQKAKTFLQGGVFEVKNRELTVGDN